MLRLGSYGGSTSTTSHGHPKSPADPFPSPPLEAYPPPPTARAKSTDILINRSHQLKRIAKGTATFYQGIAEAHNSHSLTLKKLSAPGTTPIPTPFPEASLFIPLPPSSSSSTAAGAALSPDDPAPSALSLGGTGSEGWQQILQEARETNLRTAEAHQELARRITKDVVGPLMRCRVDLKQHIALMDKDLSKHVDAVQRERDTAAPLLSRLSTSLTQSSLPLSAPTLSPVEDPVLLRAQLEAQLRLQVLRENDLLAAVKLWSERTEHKERDTFAEIKRCWAAWEQANSSMLLGNQQQSMFLSATVDSVPPDAEWHHFLRLNHLVLPDTRPKTLDDVKWEGKGDPLTSVVREGLLERQTSILKSWKPAYFVLTPSGHLHIYGPPPASATAAAAAEKATDAPAAAAAAADDADAASLSSAPATTAAACPPLSPSAQYLLVHSSPHLSLNLALCTLGPMPTPVPAPPPPPALSAEDEAASSSSSAKKASKKPLDAVFTLIESVGKGGKGDGTGTRHVVRCRGEDGGWEEMGGWVASIGKFCAPPTAPPPPASPPTPTPPALATLPPTAAAADDRKLSPSPSPSNAHSPLASPRSVPPPFVPLGAAGAAAGATGAAAALAAGPPALPDRPSSSSSFFSSPSTPPALPPRDATAPPALPRFDSSTSLDSPTGGFEARHSVLVIDDDEGAAGLSRAMGALGIGAAAGAAVGAAAAAERREVDGDERRDEDAPTPSAKSPVELELEDQDGDDDDAASDAGDLGRSLSQSGVARRDPRERERVVSPRQGSVRSLAAAWESQGAGAGAGAAGEGEGEKRPSLGVPALERGEDESLGEEEGSDAGERSFGAEGEGEGEGEQEPRGEQGGEQGEQEQEQEQDRPAQKNGKKGKKKRKSKAAGGAKPTERPLPLPSVDPEHADLGLPSPHSPSFADARTLDGDDVERREEGDEDEVRSPPPMVLEEVDEAPSPALSRGSEEREREEQRQGQEEEEEVKKE
ncbi:hypothetical protein DMC30DRAFT_435080 [Rhodotorula diobovata]|uniref:PH domain-containing protein n=1 Tax=Rhodotorula diobovata TaxID=5288 RepID=A0A5C5FZY5_9BASI|nr:hypothetical protein DMC30DRAFT_435080 [Rhodotorula diobovata]